MALYATNIDEIATFSSGIDPASQRTPSEVCLVRISTIMLLKSTSFKTRIAPARKSSGR